MCLLHKNSNNSRCFVDIHVFYLLHVLSSCPCYSGWTIVLPLMLWVNFCFVIDAVVGKALLTGCQGDMFGTLFKCTNVCIIVSHLCIHVLLIWETVMLKYALQYIHINTVLNIFSIFTRSLMYVTSCPWPWLMQHIVCPWCIQHFVIWTIVCRLHILIEGRPYNWLLFSIWALH